MQTHCMDSVVLGRHADSKHRDPFRDRTANLNSQHNPYVQMLQCKHLPVLHSKRLQHISRNWSAYFTSRGMSPPQALLVEIGCYRGRNLLQIAQRYPHTACIGIDLTFKRVVLTAQAIAAYQLPNAVSVLSDAHDLTALFQPDTLDGIVCFFPDPWAKPRQRKKRLLSTSYCAQLANLLKAGGFLWLKTDDADYFTQAQQALLALGFRTANTQPLALTSAFEQRFLADGRKIYRMVLINHKTVPITVVTHPLVWDNDATKVACG